MLLKVKHLPQHSFDRKIKGVRCNFEGVGCRCIFVLLGGMIRGSVWLTTKRDRARVFCCGVVIQF